MSLFACSVHSAQPLPPPQQDPDLGVTDPAPRMAVFAGGCFWCTEASFEQLNGVVDVVSGYAGGSAEQATYQQVGRGGTGHAECVRITYNPTIITYGTLLQVFFSAHDPTDAGGQGPDRGSQYRTAIFPQNDAQAQAARAYITQLTEAKSFSRAIATRIEEGQTFFPAEDYHQDFVRRNPNQPYVRARSKPEADRVAERFPELLAPKP